MASNQGSSAAELKPGDQFNRYTIVQRIGEGGMARVYEAMHVDLQKRVALKTMLPWFSLRTDLVQRFMIEARAAARLEHLHVVAVHDIGVEQNIPFMAMDLLEGEDLSSMVARLGMLSVERVAGIFLPIASALSAAHRVGILHRDLKPENIFIAKRAPFGEHPMLLDFGLSKVDIGAPVKSLTASGEILGTPPFMAPETVVGGMDRYTARSDQYAIGVAIYECITGKLPYPEVDEIQKLLATIAKGGAEPPSKHRPALPPAFDQFVQKAIALSPNDRFSSMRTLGRALLPFASPMHRALWSGEFEEKGGSRTTMEVVPFRTADMRAVPALKDASDLDLGRAAALSEITKLKAGSSLFVQGTAGSSCYLILSGEIELSRTYGPITHEIGTIGAGAIAGLAALWDKGPRPVSAIAKKESIVVEISRAAFTQIEKLCPRIADKLLDEAIREAVDRMGRATRYSAPTSKASASNQDPDALIQIAASLREWSFPIPPSLK